MSSFNRFKHQLDSALDLLENSEQIKQLDLPQVLGAQMVDTESLLSRCTHICDKHKQKKPTIRIIHHLACSGGTLISKCISSLPNVYLLSEIYPFVKLPKWETKPQFSPTDISRLIEYSGIPNKENIQISLFKSAINITNESVHKAGGVLILRDHSHSDYCDDSQNSEYQNTVYSLLSEDYDIRSIATIRDPIDSYISLKKNGWVHFNPETFDEYCNRIIIFLSNFERSNIFKYEDFISNPECELEMMAKKLDITYSSEFSDIFGISKVTGDSGRSGDFILKRERVISKNDLEEMSSNENYKKIMGLIS
ncbi:TPA: hypothetical protein NKQ48_000724 [Vibrio parahaemolyticus]|nr:hypothetical protein [Vibrio parahaemolyticus]MBE4362144.1 hypothetical protein [Vibrio parahaemolyticus]MBE5185244.1 hypothetical protein [Vibrio parahaemolyticus]MBE5198764.1 hypothetical protein [Vibrio parahaemolyticus]HCG8166698.1 hypothetical protein [Vibrio parahaemolyticus]